MRKSVLIKNNQLLEDKLLEADSVIKELKEDISLLKDKIKLLQSENSNLYEELSAKELEIEEITAADEETVAETVVEDCEDVAENVPMGFQIDTEVLDIKENNSDNLKEFAVSVIAKIILECTKADLTVSASNFDSKDNDRNIILGSAEASKSRIYSFLSENKESEYTKAKIEAELANYSACVQNILVNYL